jgi:hypothetical protein
MSLKNLLATENTEFTEEKPLIAANIGLTHQVSRKKYVEPALLCALCGLN